MENQEPGYFEKTEKLLQQYVSNRLLLFKLKITEKTSRLASMLVIFILLLMLGFFVLFFISIMAGYFFAEITGSLFYGFGIVTLGYILIFILALLLRKKYIDPFITNSVIRIFFDKTSGNENTEAEPQD
jgi:protein-S-isoprenylcysteine O-methyltransferase Ste14